MKMAPEQSALPLEALIEKIVQKPHVPLRMYQKLCLAIAFYPSVLLI